MSLNILYIIDLVGVIERVRELLKGYPSLLLVFNAYVPNGYEIMLNDEEKASSKKATNNEEECNLVKNIKVAVLFNYYSDLLYEFTEFLKDSVTPNQLSSLLLVLNPLLPCGYDIIPNDEVKFPLKKSIHFEQKHLVNNHEYKSFQDIKNKCRTEHKDVKEVYHETVFMILFVTTIFLYLLDEFSRILPNFVTTNPLYNLDGEKN
ncbi:hypothetical protein H5410_050896 [Solanum commersonii]|uniref:Uncharacterized protein n=1 Tax=Solanum commersonii TaxID=4109 RepID=A0A9J5WYE9_SOLCO|nr:hypothetical protein H5410_050896 [Solanum commersonii]